MYLLYNRKRPINFYNFILNFYWLTYSMYLYRIWHNSFLRKTNKCNLSIQGGKKIKRLLQRIFNFF